MQASKSGRSGGQLQHLAERYPRRRAATSPARTVRRASTPPRRGVRKGSHVGVSVAPVPEQPARRRARGRGARRRRCHRHRAPAPTQAAAGRRARARARSTPRVQAARLSGARTALPVSGRRCQASAPAIRCGAGIDRRMRRDAGGGVAVRAPAQSGGTKSRRAILEAFSKSERQKAHSSPPAGRFDNPQNLACIGLGRPAAGRKAEGGADPVRLSPPS